MKQAFLSLLFIISIPTQIFASDIEVADILKNNSLLRADLESQGLGNDTFDLLDKMSVQTFSDETLEAMRQMGISEEMINRMRSGDIVGNGGGTAEANFFYAYRKLPKILSDCLQTFHCHLNDEQKTIIRKIRTIAHINMSKADKFIFLNKRTAPGFFMEDDDPQIRIAKTGFTDEAPIFVNLDLIYDENNLPISTPKIISLLVHEIGHQAGVRSHQYLDELGSRIRNYLNDEKLNSKISVNGIKFNMSVFNFRDRAVYSEVNMDFMGLRIELGERIFNKAECSMPGRNLIGYSIENLYFNRVINIDQTWVVPMKAWIKLYCVDENSTFWPEEKDLNIDFKIQRRFLPPGWRYTIENITIYVN